MSVDVERADDLSPAEWDELVERARYTDAVHQWDALNVLAEHSDSTVHRLVGYKGQEPVGVFPVFERRYGPLTAAFSPPPGLRIVYLGPGLLNMAKLSRRKVERRQRAFVDGAFEWLESNVNPRYVHLRTTPDYPDIRPFVWNGCDVTPTYTYHVDLTLPESDLLDRFSRDARTNVTADPDVAYDIREGGVSAIDRVIEQVRARYESQGIAFDVSASFVRDLYEGLPEGAVRPYVCRVDDEFSGGIIAFEFGDTVARWQGGVKPDSDHDLPTNDLLDWELMRAGRERGREVYDLVGASAPRVNRYKLKFAPELVHFYSIERGTALGTLAARVYQRLPWKGGSSGADA